MSHTDEQFDATFDVMKKVEKILKKMSDRTNPHSEYHRKNQTSPGRHTATLALEEAELDILKLLSSKKVEKDAPLIRYFLNANFKGTKAERQKKRLAELNEDPIQKIIRTLR